MDPLTLALIMGGTGLAKGATIDRWKEDRQRNLAANTQRYSPWTGLRAGPIEEADPFGSAMQGGVQGYALGQNIEAAEAGKKLTEAQTAYLQAMNGGQKQDASNVLSMEPVQADAPPFSVGAGAGMYRQSPSPFSVGNSFYPRNPRARLLAGGEYK